MTPFPIPLLIAGLATAVLPGQGPAQDDPRTAVESVSAQRIRAHIETLASDAFEGRAPGTPGEDRTIAYLTDQFRKLGLQAGNPNGSFIQDVPLVGFQSRGDATIRVGGKTIAPKFPDDWVPVSRRQAAETVVNGSDLVFVGYGVVAPEYGWDDYKGQDMTGKTLVMLVNDPAVPDPNDPSKLDPAAFKGKAMTYYGRWTYKYEIASEKKAAAALIIHETGPAGYPYEVVSGSWGRENFDIPSGDGNAGRVALEGWLANAAARKLLQDCGQDLDDLKAKAIRRDFRPVPLGAKIDFRVHNQVREVRSRNVVARLEGSDPALKDEVVLYSAHWDHLGKDPALQGDQIFNGAADNASGTAALLEIAHAYAQLKTKPRRSIVFLAVTAEEKGLLGSKYYATHPLYPLAKTLAAINMDVINTWGRTRDVVNIGMGNSTLDEVLEAVATRQGRTVGPDAEPEKGLFYRSDHFEFAKQGVPALYPKAGMAYVGKPADYGQQKREEYTTRDYHKVSDEVKPDWDLSGAVEDAQLLIEVGHRVAQGNQFPEWKKGTEFKARREAMLSRPSDP